MSYTWEDTITADQTAAREKHRRDLCANVNLELVRRTAVGYTWTHTPGLAAVDVLLWGKVDIDQLYAACTAAKAACSYDATVLPAWPTITQDQTLVRAAHITQLRIYIDDLNNIACPTHCPTPCGPCAYSCPCQSHCDSHCGMHCWVAKEIFGSWEHPKTIAVRFFIDHMAPRAIREFYINNGERIAKFISNRWYLRALMRPLFEVIAWLGRCPVEWRLA